MKANGIHPNGGPSDKPATPATPREKLKASTTKITASKKRKIGESAADIKANTEGDGMLAKMQPETKDHQHIKAELITNEHKTAIVKSPPPTTMPTSLPVPLHSSPPPQPKQLFQVPHMAYTHSRHYHPHMAQYQGPVMPLPRPSYPSPMPRYPYPLQQRSILPQKSPSLDDTSIFEDFCTPELFEQRTFLEMPQVEAPIPLPSPQVTMKDLSIDEESGGKLEENPVQIPAEIPVERRVERRVEHAVERLIGKPAEKPAASQSGRRPSESILIID